MEIREDAARADFLTPMFEELMEAHLDTIEVVLDMEPDVDWLSHIDYLQRLYREGQTLLAQLRPLSNEQPGSTMAGPPSRAGWSG